MEPTDPKMNKLLSFDEVVDFVMQAYGHLGWTREQVAAQLEKDTIDGKIKSYTADGKLYPCRHSTSS